MKRGSTGIVLSPAFLGELNPNGGRGSRGQVETSTMQSMSSTLNTGDSLTETT
jgi:hypothetical protein